MTELQVCMEFMSELLILKQREWHISKLAMGLCNHWGRRQVAFNNHLHVCFPSGGLIRNETQKRSSRLHLATTQLRQIELCYAERTVHCKPGQGEPAYIECGNDAAAMQVGPSSNKFT